MRMFAVEQTRRVHRECAVQTKEAPMAPRGLFEKPVSDTDEAFSGETKRALLFGLVAALAIALMVLVGVSSETAATHLAQLNVETSGSHIF